MIFFTGLKSSKHGYLAAFIMDMLAYKPEERMTSENIVAQLETFMEKTNDIN